MLPDEIKGKLLSLQKMLSKMAIKCKFVESENLHISLSFLGEVNDIRVVVDNLKSAVKGFNKFNVNVKNVLLIPNENFIRVIALDVIDEKSVLENLRLKVKDIVGGKSYEAHVTLCRVKTIENKKSFQEKINSLLDYDAGIFEVNGLQLIKSELSRNGPIYSIVEGFSLE